MKQQFQKFVLCRGKRMFIKDQYYCLNGMAIRKFIINQEDKMDCSQQFQPASQSHVSQESYKRPKKQQKYVSGQQNGKWSEIENAKYIAYIEFHKDKMRSKEKRRVNKLYKEMAKFVGTRNALQCRSHHQKLEDRYLYPNKIISNYKQHHENTLYAKIKQELEDYEQQLAALAAAQLKPSSSHLPSQENSPSIPLPSQSSTSSQENFNLEPSQDIVLPTAFSPSYPIYSIPTSEQMVALTNFLYYPFFQIY